MIHTSRRYRIVDVASAAELAEKLTQHSWCGCNGFRLGAFLYLNDAFSENGAQEFAVVRESDGAQVDSVTFSWCKEDKAREIIERVESDEAAGKSVAFQHLTMNYVTAHPPGPCRLCA
jgi:hypothetical protein